MHLGEAGRMARWFPPQQDADELARRSVRDGESGFPPTGLTRPGDATSRIPP
jgi:hypothetical protein